MNGPVRSGWERVACNLCGSETTRRFAQRGGIPIVECLACGLVFVNPRPGLALMRDHYNQGLSSRLEYYRDAEVADRRTFVEILDLVARFAPPPSQLLEVGPNIGTCLALARERGWAVRGVEINAEAAKECRQRHGLDVIAGTLEEGGCQPDSQDVVLLLDVIEHLTDPLGTMRGVAGTMRRGGVVVISTPNIASLAARLLQIKPDEHLYYFNAATMSRLLREVGLEPILIRSFDRYHNLTAMTHSTTGGGVLRRLEPVFRLAHRMVGDAAVRLPLGENLLVVGRKAASDGRPA
jgi:2-polyprenyl-3-methyl-5-hydroxy-6-metoxy-1,4-benzoquinol methylase